MNRSSLDDIRVFNETYCDMINAGQFKALLVSTNRFAHNYLHRKLRKGEFVHATQKIDQQAAINSDLDIRRIILEQV